MGKTGGVSYADAKEGAQLAWLRFVFSAGEIGRERDGRSTAVGEFRGNLRGGGGFWGGFWA
ncbi:hypothetical protein B9K06_25235 [Bacillus sp. OG2]|nr:hypothetical protein B9K06_25235 [Bacillus sp. OG2]